MIPRIKGRGQGCGHRVLSPGRYSAETKKRRSIRPTKTLFRTSQASEGNKIIRGAFPTENPQIGKRGQGNLSAGKIEKPQRKKPERLQNKIRAEKTSRPPPAATAATLPKPINCTLSAKKIAFRVFNTSIRLPLRFVPIRHPHIYYNKSFPFGQAFFDVFLFAARQFRPNGANPDDANPDGAKCPRVPPFIRTYARRFLSGRDTVL